LSALPTATLLAQLAPAAGPGPNERFDLGEPMLRSAVLQATWPADIVRLADA